MVKFDCCSVDSVDNGSEGPTKKAVSASKGQKMAEDGSPVIQ